MERRARKIADSLAEAIRKWDNTSAVVLGEAAGIETIDPYFNIDIDVYLTGRPAPSAERSFTLGSPAGFESNSEDMTDSFFVEDLPVSIAYKEVARIDRILDRVSQGRWAFRNETTHLLYRIQQGLILFDQGSWFSQARARLEDVSDRFWDNLKEASRNAGDRWLNGIGAAVYRGDYLYYQIAATRFLQCLCSFLFALNRRFEPSPQLLMDHVVDLEHLPAEFKGRFDNLIRPDIEINPQRRYEVAQLVAKSIRLL